MKQDCSQDFLLLTSPPASGKTYWVRLFIKSLEKKKVLFLSPLRALAEECLKSWGDFSTLSIMTPEEWLIKQDHFDVVIFDEFHLYFYWGSSFRPKMWEAFYGLVENLELAVGLTATFSTSIQEEVANFHCHFHSFLWIDFGNQQLKYSPYQYLRAYSKQWIMRQIFLENKKDQIVRLIFCSYRQEVQRLTKMLQDQGFSAVSCVGGEAKEMQKKLSLCPYPHFIVATTVLGHGVNLPAISQIYLLYPLKNIDFWIQMVARGGRQGQKYLVIGMERPHGIPWNFIKNIAHLLLLSFKARLKIFYRSYLTLYDS